MRWNASQPLNTQVKKPIWVKPSFKDLPIFFEVCLYAGSEPAAGGIAGGGVVRRPDAALPARL
jgi:hypothetical protein